MQKKDTWLLPEGIEDVLPDATQILEILRRRLLDVLSVWGYQQVIPPFVDFLDSLLSGSGHDLDLQTFKLTDQISGETLGIRADMTPLVARIDAHHLKHDYPTRLCYVGTTLQTLGDSLEKNRCPMQIGAELYGHAGLESDWEIIQLLLEVLANTGVLDVHLDLGHVGVYRALAEQAGLDAQQEAELFAVLQRKARADLAELLAEWDIAPHFKAVFVALPTLNGGVEVLQQADSLLSIGNEAVKAALQDLQRLADLLAIHFPSLPVSFDLAELRGYHYHTGIVFAAFVPGMGKEVARGGRYDNIGQFFGRARPATGFSADLKVLARLFQQHADNESPQTIFAPYVQDADLLETVRDLRASGKTVIGQLPGQVGDARQMGCTAVLEKSAQQWVVNPLV